MWSFDELFLKSATLARRGLDHPDPDSSEVPLWCFVSLEMLARSALANINVALLADPSDGNNILYACGFPSTKSPRSIPAKTVFHRCTVVCPSFTKKEYESCLIWTNLRNEELHTGALSLDGLRSSKWMARYFEIVDILLQHLGKSLDEFVGASHAATAAKMIAAVSEKNKKAAYAAIASAKEEFEKNDVKVRLEKIGSGEKKREEDYAAKLAGYEIVCPACEGPAVVTGDMVRSTTPHDEDGELVQEDVRIPTKLKCYACDLELSGHPMLHAIDRGDQFTKKDWIDPKDYYSIEFDPEDYYDDSYMNC